MTDDTPKLTRRKTLASLGVIGGAAGIGGLGTSAMFTDPESAATSFTAGSLDLKLDWRVLHNGTVAAEQATPTNTDGEVAIQLTDVKPCDEICFLLSIHVESNPAWLWGRMGLVKDRENGTNEPEEECEDDGMECPVTEYALVCGQENTDGNVTVTTEDSTLVVTFNAGSHHDFEETHLHVGQDCDDVPISGGGGPTPGQFTYDDSDADTIEDDRVVYRLDFDSEGISCGDELCIAAHAADDQGETCWGGTFEFPGANWALGITHTVCCPTDGGVDTSGGELDEAMLFEAFYDDDDDCTLDATDQRITQGPVPVAALPFTNGDYTPGFLLDGFRGPGAVQPVDAATSPFFPDSGQLSAEFVRWYGETVESFYGDSYSTQEIEDAVQAQSGTQWIAMKFTLPCDVGNCVQTDSFGLSLQLFAQQARHNAAPSNPWGQTGNVETDLVPAVDPP